MVLKVTWLDTGKEPSCPPNPMYPNGIELDLRANQQGSYCLVDLPYPARRIGSYLIECSACGRTAGCTTAGRPDDPISVKVPCKSKGEN